MRKPRCHAVRSLLALVAITLFAVPQRTVAQQIVLSGVVVDSAARSSVTGAMVTLGNNPRVVTNGSGGFTFVNQRPGEFELKVEAVGYAPYSETLTIRGDTSLTIFLSLQPIPVDPLDIKNRRVKVEGWIEELSNGTPVMGASVIASGGRQERTKRPGYFEFDDVYAQLPLEIWVLAFGFEPVYLSLAPLADTTLNIQLKPDTMIERLLAGQVKRLEKRAAAVTGNAYAIDRATLLSYPGGQRLDSTIVEITRYAPFALARGRTCYIVDEQPVPANYVAEIYPDEVHRVEYFTNGLMNMIRIYTRAFMAEMIASNRPLRAPAFNASPRGFLGNRTPVSTACY